MSLPRSSPERQGVDSNRLLAFFNAIDTIKHELHSFMLVKNGHVISEGWWKPYAPWLSHKLFSLSKSFTSTAVGFASDEGLLSVDDLVVSFFPEEMKALDGRVDDKLCRMTLRHLLTMSTGQTYEAWPEAFNDGFVRAFLASHIKNEPGSVFMYNSNVTFMLSAIIQKITGQTLTAYLTPRLFNPLGIAVPYWEQCGDGIDFGGFGLNVKMEDIAKFGLFYLQKGVWQGKRLLSEAWVEAATAKQIATDAEPKQGNDWSFGYGYQFWQCSQNAFRGDGAFGQFCFVVPESNAVIAITSNADMQHTMNMVWEHLLPALKDTQPVTEGDAYRQLLDIQSRLCMPEPDETGEFHIPPLFNETACATYDIRMDKSPQDGGFNRLSLEHAANGQDWLLNLWQYKQEWPMFTCTYRTDDWTEACLPYPYGARLARASVRLYGNGDTFTFYNRCIQTPFTDKLTLTFLDGGNSVKGELCRYELLTQQTIAFEGTLKS